MPNHKIHTYRRLNIGIKKPYLVMHCIHCPSYVPMKSTYSCPRLIGKEAICPDCQEKFILDRRALIMVNPKCEQCRGDKKIKIDAKKTEDFFEMLERLAKV